MGLRGVEECALVLCMRAMLHSTPSLAGPGDVTGLWLFWCLRHAAVCKPGFGGPSCDQCTVGFWANGTSKAACTACTANTTTTAAGATSAAECSGEELS